jgi:hypothetical protein
MAIKDCFGTVQPALYLTVFRPMSCIISGTMTAFSLKTRMAEGEQDPQIHQLPPSFERLKKKQ